MKVPDGSHAECVLTRGKAWISDGQGSMSKQSNSSDCEYSQRLREHEVQSNRLSFIVPLQSTGYAAFAERKVRMLVRIA